MIAFPVFERLIVQHYGLYPGEPPGSGLEIQFRGGLTLILGANGLGKTTLITILFRALTGPYDIPALENKGGLLGTSSIDAAELPSSRRAIFAQRVFDGAKNAEMRFEFSMGNRHVLVERRLKDLSIAQFTIDGIAYPRDEETFQGQIIKLSGLGSFGDWILLLRHLTFYLEDRRALVWDASAQRQLLRLLFLSPEEATTWVDREREILTLDSHVRNLNAALYRVERDLSSSESKISGAHDLRRELNLLEELQSTDIPKLDVLNDDTVELDAARERARLRLLNAEKSQEASFRNAERSKLSIIKASFPTQADSSAYIFSQLLTNDRCLVCGNHPDGDIIAALSERLRTSHCVVCNSDVSRTDNVLSGAEFAEASYSAAIAEFELQKAEAQEAREILTEAENAYERHIETIVKLNSEVADRTAQIQSILRRLPPEETALVTQRSELAALRSRVAEQRLNLDSMRRDFHEFVESANRELVEWSAKVKGLFANYAEGFLLETCDLFWSPQKARLGQTGEYFEFPAFQLAMSGTDFPSAVRRSGPDQVSESQREFIDLAFRMALMEATGEGSGATLVIDAPESSLDAVFSGRAADVLSRFAMAMGENRLVLTSNLTEGQLIPKLLSSVRASSPSAANSVDLFNVAAPTAAVKRLRAEYDAVKAQLLGGPQ